MRITYFALRPLLVGSVMREPGDLVPEARDWAYLHGYIADGKIAPVLVVTLPEDAQMTLMEWEADQDLLSKGGIKAPAKQSTKA